MYCLKFYHKGEIKRYQNCLPCKIGSITYLSLRLILKLCQNQDSITRLNFFKNEFTQIYINKIDLYQSYEYLFKNKGTNIIRI